MHYKKLIIEYLKKVDAAHRKELDNLLYDKLPDILSDKQKVSKVKNLLHEMEHKDFSIETIGENIKSKWRIKI